MESKQRWSIAATVGLAASLIGILTFVSGRHSLADLLTRESASAIGPVRPQDVSVFMLMVASSPDIPNTANECHDGRNTRLVRGDGRVRFPPGKIEFLTDDGSFRESIDFDDWSLLGFTRASNSAMTIEFERHNDGACYAVTFIGDYSEIGRILHTES